MVFEHLFYKYVDICRGKESPKQAKLSMLHAGQFSDDFSYAKQN